MDITWKLWEVNGLQSTYYWESCKWLHCVSVGASTRGSGWLLVLNCRTDIQVTFTEVQKSCGINVPMTWWTDPMIGLSCPSHTFFNLCIVFAGFSVTMPYMDVVHLGSPSKSNCHSTIFGQSKTCGQRLIRRGQRGHAPPKLGQFWGQNGIRWNTVFTPINTFNTCHSDRSMCMTHVPSELVASPASISWISPCWRPTHALSTWHRSYTSEAVSKETKCLPVSVSSNNSTLGSILSMKTQQVHYPALEYCSMVTCLMH